MEPLILQGSKGAKLVLFNISYSPEGLLAHGYATEVRLRKGRVLSNPDIKIKLTRTLEPGLKCVPLGLNAPLTLEVL